MSIAARRRWDWINGFLTACLHSVLENTHVPVGPSLTFQEFHRKYLERLSSEFTGTESLRITVPEYGVRYIFQLEAELWGANWEQYVGFFPDPNDDYEPLQTFAFVHAFFLIERTLELFAQSHEGDGGRRQRRRYLFGWESGLFSTKYPESLAALGPPFFLNADTRRVYCLGGRDQEWQALKRVAVTGPLKDFYNNTTGKDHFAEIIEAGFVSTREKHLPKQFGGRLVGQRRRRRLESQVRAYWYDVFWNYSESVRYHPISPDERAATKPFYWNRSIRWLASTAITGLLSVLAKCGGNIGRVWVRMYKESKVLRGVFDEKRFAL